MCDQFDVPNQGDVSLPDSFRLFLSLIYLFMGHCLARARYFWDKN